MKQINYALGLPRSGSTLLMNILQQNPLFFSSSTCPNTYIIDNLKSLVKNTPEFIAMEQDVLKNALTNFIKYGMDGWFSSLTDKPIIFSKSRLWYEQFNFIFSAYENPKVIVCLRVLRDIICSFEKLSKKYYFWDNNTRIFPTFDQRIKLLLEDVNGNIGLPLKNLPYVYDWVLKKPNNFYIFKFENFIIDPVKKIKEIYHWLELPYFEHNLSNIPPAAQYEHDTVYRSFTSHKTDFIFKEIKPTWPEMMTINQAEYVVNSNEWYYRTFYSEIL